MSIVKLGYEHRDKIRDLFTFTRIMGSDVKSSEYEYLKTIGEQKDFNTKVYDNFCETFLSGLNLFHSFGYVENDTVKAIISFYECEDEPSWYCCAVYGSGNRDYLIQVLDTVIDYNEKNGRNKFYAAFNIDHAKIQRRLYWSKYNNDRYGFYNEYVLPKRTKSIYYKHWMILFNQILLPNDSLVRCNYLKQEYRNTTLLGNI